MSPVTEMKLVSVHTVLCKSNESEFRRNLCFVLIEIRRRFTGNFAHVSEIS